MMLQTETCLLDWWFEIGCGSALRNERCPNLDDSPTSEARPWIPFVTFLDVLLPVLVSCCYCHGIIVAVHCRPTAAFQTSPFETDLKLTKNTPSTTPTP